MREKRRGIGFETVAGVGGGYRRNTLNQSNQSMPIPLVIIKTYFKVNASHLGDNPLLEPTWIQIATKPLPGPNPNTREHENIGNLSASRQPLWMQTVQFFPQLFGIHNAASINTSYREVGLMCCPSIEVIKSHSKGHLAFGGLLL